MFQHQVRSLTSLTTDACMCFRTSHGQTVGSASLSHHIRPPEIFRLSDPTATSSSYSITLHYNLLSSILKLKICVCWRNWCEVVEQLELILQAPPSSSDRRFHMLQSSASAFPALALNPSLVCTFYSPKYTRSQSLVDRRVLEPLNRLIV